MKCNTDVYFVVTCADSAENDFGSVEVLEELVLFDVVLSRAGRKKDVAGVQTAILNAHYRMLSRT